jgi:RimJ/RimL family protein N-acetyltransferase
MADVAFDHLCSPRLTLRRFQATDLPVFCGYRSDPAIARYQSWTAFTEADGQQFFANQSSLHPDMPGTWFQMVIERTEDRVMVGDCALHTPADPPKHAEIGFTLASAHHGQGFATEAVACLLDYVFRTLDKHRAFAITDARNIPAARVLERVGMRREGHFLQNAWFKGQWGDEFLYAMLGDEWRKRQGVSGPLSISASAPLALGTPGERGRG